jgi:16S rRNA (cytosine1402-N4)-methyltransferase
MSIKAHPPQNNALHVPVLLEQVLQVLDPQPGETYLDLTAGYGGHAQAVLTKTNNYKDSVLVDRDENAINELKPLQEKGATLLHDDFASAASQLTERQNQFDLVLVDLGVSSPQLDRAERGFSFTNNGPLDMRMDPSKGPSAADLVNTMREDALADLIVQYGEEPRGFAQRIARAITRNRPIVSTKELADLILNEHKGRWQRIHPATRTFQALRIATNDELGQIQTLLSALPKLLKPGGRVAIISFHSLEDRLVKQYFKEQAGSGYEAELEILTKKAVDGAIYDVHNPRARSAKLRAARKK